MPLRRLIAYALRRPWLLGLVVALLCTPPFAAAVNRPGRTPFGEPRHDIVRPNPKWHTDPLVTRPAAPQPGRPLYWAKLFYDPAGKPLTTFEPTMRFPAVDPPGAPYIPPVDWRQDFSDRCDDKIIWCGSGYGAPPAPPARGPTGRGPSGPSIPAPSTEVQQREQSWTMDGFGNWTGFTDQRPYWPGGTDTITATPFEWTGQFTAADQHEATGGQTVESEFETGPVGVTPHFDASGNMIDDGKRFAFEYDARNQLVAVYWRDAEADEPEEGYRGALYARYTYNALGWRTSAVYDRDNEALGLFYEEEPAEVYQDPAVFNNDYVELYAYDEQWRLIAVHRQIPATEVEEDVFVRPDPVVDEIYHWQPGAFPADGPSGGLPLDRLICRQRSTAHDGNLDETFYYVQNSRGDVVALLRPIDGPDVEPPTIVIGGGGGEEGMREAQAKSGDKGKRGNTHERRSTVVRPRGSTSRGEPSEPEFSEPPDPETDWPVMNPYRLAYPVERYRYLTYGEPLCFGAADVNLDAHVNELDYSAFAYLEAANDLRADLNGNGVLKPDTGTWEDPSMWDGADTNLFELEYARATCYEHKEIGNVFVGDGDALAIESGERYTDGGGVPVLSQPDHTFYKDSELQELPCVGINNRFGYGGYWFEPELGVYFVRHRVLDPKSGRWLTRDPIGYAGG